MLPSWIKSEELQAAVVVLLGNGDYQAQVGLSQLFLGLFGVGLAAQDLL